MDIDIQLLEGIVVASTALLGITGLVLTELRIKDPQELTNMNHDTRKLLNFILLISISMGLVTTFGSLGYFFAKDLIATVKWVIWVIFAIQGSTFFASMIILASTYKRN